jgi:16S rRNA (guanine1207-N2)-methyltransferase
MTYILEETLLGFPLSFKTSDACFSPKRIDTGTRVLISYAPVKPGLKILDLGCGYGAVGIACAKAVGQDNVVMLDIDPEAVRLARENAERNEVPKVRILQSDGFTGLDVTGFDLILSNPPYHCDFSVPKMFIEKGYNRLKIGGRLLMVTKRREWYKRKLISVFGGVRLHEAEGYFVFEAEKRLQCYASTNKNIRKRGNDI